MQDCKPIDTPLAKGEILSRRLCPKNLKKKEQMSKVPYLSTIRSLMYSMMCTRSYICHAVGMANRYQSNLGQEHWKEIKRILRYLKDTAEYSLCYQGKELRLKWYTNADWEGDLDEKKPTYGFAFLLNNGAISWSSKKQSYLSVIGSLVYAMMCTRSDICHVVRMASRYQSNLGQEH